ncbi:MAG: hypothetical protein JSU63_19665 [Phycisphaerales bacterium]|nr:MAG: hypothetical protein JSU63_19665 [Phycisphaerales bacterium]
MRALIAMVLWGAGLVSVGIVSQTRPPVGYEGGCTDAGCHDKRHKRPVVHDPVGEQTCDACHELTNEEKHEFKFPLSGAALCFDCHEEHEGEVMHSPAEDGECTSCHDPHASQTKALLKEETIAAVCIDCHDDMREDLDFLHGPCAVGACTMCHNPHGTDHAMLLPTEGPGVCTRCHTEMGARMTEKTYKHSPVEEECTGCHNPHGAKNNMMLKDYVPQLCVDCHDDIQEHAEDSLVKHDALTQGKSCVDCHQAHCSSVEHNLLKEPMDLCLSCHDKELDSDQAKLISIADVLQENPHHHGPIAQKSCTGCHGVHGGEVFRMLIEEFPPGFYESFDKKRYALCFRCHEPELVQDERTTTLTKFRNGDWNMHYLHVNRKPKGRTCRACHNVHASKRPRHVAETVPFGAWDVPVNFEVTETGGTCLPGCHRRYSYDRGKAVINIPKK